MNFFFLIINYYRVIKRNFIQGTQQQNQLDKIRN